MKNKLLLILFFTFFISFYCHSQTKFMISGGMDFIKTDFREPFKKFQGGLEFNYLLKQKLTLNAGYEFWSDNKNFVAIGTRIYFLSFIYIKPRILFNPDDFNGSISIGYNYFLGRRMRWESSIDFYTNSPELAIRTGFAYVFTK